MAKSGEREQVWLQPGYQVQLGLESQRTQTEAALTAARDPERNFLTDLCNSKGLACAGRHPPLRLRGARPRAGRRRCCGPRATAPPCPATSGPRAPAPAKRPAIVITNGSIQAPEPLYWWAAQTLAKAGYVVVTFDPQQQGALGHLRRGRRPQRGRARRRPRATRSSTGPRTRSTSCSPRPPSRSARAPSRSGTSHCAKQDRRVKEGRNAAFNPFWKLVDGSRIGIAGHSYGASGVSWMGQQDTRVDAVVAWDNLCDPPARPRNRGRRPAAAAARRRPGHAARLPRAVAGDHQRHVTGTESRSSDPDPTEKSRASLAFSQGRRGHRLDRDPRRHPLRVLLPAEQRVPRDAARHRSDRLVHARLVRQYVKGDPTADRAAAHARAGAATPATARSTPRARATCSRSTTARGSTSAPPPASASAARTCARAAPARWPTTAARPSSPTWTWRARPTASARASGRRWCR